MGTLSDHVALTLVIIVSMPDHMSRQCNGHVTRAGMWLDVVCGCGQEQQYCAVLLSLLSTLTQVMDLQLEGKGQGVVAPCKQMIQDVLKVSHRGILYCRQDL